MIFNAKYGIVLTSMGRMNALCPRMVAPGKIGMPSVVSTRVVCPRCARDDSYRGVAPNLSVHHCHGCGYLAVVDKREDRYGVRDNT